MTDPLVAPAPDTGAAAEAAALARIDRALARVELRIRQLQAEAATASADRAALAALQQEVAGTIGELDRLIAAAPGPKAHG